MATTDFEGTQPQRFLPRVNAGRYDVIARFRDQGSAAADTVMTAAGDFIVACTASRPIGAHFRVETRSWQAIEPASGSLLLRHPVRAGGTVVTVLRDRESASARILETAAQFAEAANADLIVICAPEIGRCCASCTSPRRFPNTDARAPKAQHSNKRKIIFVRINFTT